MPIKTFVVGTPPPTAADLNTYLVQQSHVIKASDEARLTTTLSNDSALVLPVQAHVIYWVQCFLIYSGLAAIDMSFKWTAPTGCSFQWMSDSLGSSSTTYFGPISRSVQSMTSNPSFGTASATAFTVAPVKGLLTVGNASGNLRVQWAQANLDAGNALTMRAGSMIALRRMG